jgi:LysM repeat protein
MAWRRHRSSLVFTLHFPKLAIMLKSFLLTGAFIVATTVSAQIPATQLDVANMREDIRGLSQKVSDLSLRVEQLERDNNELRGRAGTTEKTYITLNQLNDAVSDLDRSLKSALASSKSDTLAQVGSQIEKLAKQTNAAIDSLAKGMATRTPVQTTFSDEYSKEGVSYTVQKGDSLAIIAKKFGAKSQDIINANKIPDASRIQVGQTLFIPGAVGEKSTVPVVPTGK